MGRSPPLPHHPQRRRQRGTAGAQYAGSSGLININKDDALLHLLTGHHVVLLARVGCCSDKDDAAAMLYTDSTSHAHTMFYYG